jgi:hypothetical protein
MIVTIIVPTGEVRQARAGEYYQLEDATWTIHMSWTVGKYPIGIAHEIEMPEGATFLIPLWGSSTYGVKDAIPLPRPKVKVKKWQWVMKDETELNGLLFTSGHYTDEEFLNDWRPKGWYHKIDETMIEVSE